MQIRSFVKSTSTPGTPIIRKTWKRERKLSYVVFDAETGMACNRYVFALRCFLSSSLANTIGIILEVDRLALAEA